MKMENIVLNYLEQNTKVVICHECGSEFFDPIEVNFIHDYGVCVECDKKLSN